MQPDTVIVRPRQAVRVIGIAVVIVAVGLGLFLLVAGLLVNSTAVMWLGVLVLLPAGISAVRISRVGLRLTRDRAIICGYLWTTTVKRSNIVEVTDEGWIISKTRSGAQKTNFLTMFMSASHEGDESLGSRSRAEALQAIGTWLTPRITS